jgi:outer membrane protein assembly factor BamC
MQRHKTVPLAAVLVAVLVTGACGSLEIPTKKVDYKSTTKLPPLDIPPDLARPGGDDRFVVPDANPKGSATFSDFSRDRKAKPQASAAATVLPEIDKVRIDRAGTQRWLVVPGNPDQLWLTIKDFWQESGFIINVETPEAGVMETDWAENRAKIPQTGITGVIGRALDSLYATSERDKFRTRIERGGQPGTTEIYISHRGMEEVYISEGKDVLRWQPRKADPDLEAEMLRKLMVRFGVDDDRARTQLASIRPELQAKINRGADGDRLTLTDPFDRAWRRVGLALDRVGFTVEDRDRSKGLYFVRYIDPDADLKTTEDKGWLSKLKFWGGSSKIPSKEQYRILVEGGAAGAEVLVLNKDGTREKSDTANRILTLLFDQLK